MDAYKVYISKIITSYTTYEHVPATWQVGHSLTSIYSLSCFLYCITGFIIMNLTSTYPEYFEILAPVFDITLFGKRKIIQIKSGWVPKTYISLNLIDYYLEMKRMYG